MSYILRDGTGGSYLAKVSPENRQHTVAITQTTQEQAAIDGRAYNLNTGDITLTDAVDTPVMYLKNNNDQDLVISAVACGFGASDGTAGDPNTITLVRNPTAGTIITSTPTDIDMNQNRNYGSSLTLLVDAYKGATGDTMTDGSDIIQIYQTESGRMFASIVEILPKGKSIGIKIKPPATNSSMRCYAAIIAHLHSENI